MALALSTPLTAQVMGDPAPWIKGQWTGPWDLEQDLVNEPGGGPYPAAIKEIAHSIVLPSANPLDAASPAFGGQVVFITRRGFAPGTTSYPTFLWDPWAPCCIQEHLLVPTSIAYDMFYSGHAYLGDGRPITAGGQDMTVPGIVGQSKSFILGTDLLPGPPQWAETLGTPAGVRWYPTVVTLPDVRPLTTGATPPCGSGCGHSICCGDPEHQVFEPLTQSWGAQRPNQRRDPGAPTPACNAPTIDVLHYPRLHVLAGGFVMWVDGKASTGVDSHVAWFLRTDDSAAAADCVVAGEPYNQWIEGARTPGDTLRAAQKGAPSVHLLWPDPAGPLGTEYREVVYQFGGHWEPHDDGAGCPPPSDAVHYPANRTARMVDPDPFQTWEAVTPMPKGRVNHNAVILLDGSILLAGGEENVGGTCEYRTTPLVYRPSEMFTTGADTYKAMVSQTSLRRYHSVAGLLPDGRAFSAGGAQQDLGGGIGVIGDPYTVELFSPPYAFQSPKPGILSSFDLPWQYGAEQVFDVRIRGGGEVARVALVGASSGTHAFDSTQRYVALHQSEEPMLLGDDTWEVSVLVPPNGNVAPPGWYLLTVLAEASGPPSTPAGSLVPSAAKWIKIDDL